MKKQYVFSVLIVAVNISLAVAAVPPVEVKGAPALTVCPTSATGAIIKPSSNHSDKIVFEILSQPTLPVNVPFTAAIAADQRKLDALPRDTELDIKLKDNPVAVADIRSKVLSLLGASVTPSNAAFIKLMNVKYATAVCPQSP